MDAILCCLYLSTGLSLSAEHDHPTRWDRHVANPYGEIAVGYEADLGRFRLSLDLSHASSIPKHDQGDDRLTVRVRWFPWGAR